MAEINKIGMTTGFKKIWGGIFFSAKEFTSGNPTSARMPPMTTAIKAITIDSLTNWYTSWTRNAPITFLTPTSLTRLMARAVDKLINVIHKSIFLQPNSKQYKMRLQRWSFVVQSSLLALINARIPALKIFAFLYTSSLSKSTITVNLMDLTSGFSHKIG